MKDQSKLTHKILIFCSFISYLWLFSNCNVKPIPKSESSIDSSTEILKDLIFLSIISYNTSSELSKFAVSDIDFPRFLGTWNEIERIPIPVQGNLQNVQAIYTKGSRNTIGVKNLGRDELGNLISIEGSAILANPPKGILKVSFFPFFYADYFILAIDKDNYNHALIGGGDFNVLWILSKSPSLDISIIEKYKALGKTYGYKVENLKSFRD
jgi:apolipoprotein D and lipocalin family protein